MFKSSRKNNSNIISDIVSSSFGFGTRKDRIDRALENHEKVTINKTNHSIANRQIIISELEAKINNIGTMIKCYDEFIKYYENILELSTNEITKDASNVIFEFKNADNQVIASGNYCTMLSLIRTKKYAEYIISLSKQLQSCLETMKLILINKIINSKGDIYIRGEKVEGASIYHNFRLAQQMLVLQKLRYPNGNIIDTEIANFEQMNELKDKIKLFKCDLELVYNEFNTRLSTLLKLTEQDQFTLKYIEDTKNVIRTSDEYIAAKASHDYLEEINKLNR